MEGPLAVLLCAAALAPQQKPSPADVEKMVNRYFAAPAAEREAILAKLELTDPLKPADVKAWGKKLMALSMKGEKSPEKARNFLYDEKTKKGLYLLNAKPSTAASPLFFGLHGGGVGEGDAESAQGPWAGAIGGRGWIGVYPEVLEKTEAAWGDEPTEKFVLELIEVMKRTYKIDTNRIYLGGHSMGGYGTWTLGGRNADLFAGLCAFAGAATPYRDEKKAPTAIVEGILPNLRNLPIWVYHSRDDPRVDFPTNQVAVDTLDKLGKEYGGYAHHFDAVDKRGHDFPDPKPPLEWVAKNPRDPRPKKVVWQPFRSWKRMFYWVWWERAQASSILVAEVKGPNALDVTIKDAKNPIEGLSLLLDEKLVDLEKEVVVTLNGKEAFRGKVPRTLATMVLTAAERNDPEMLFAARVKL